MSVEDEKRLRSSNKRWICNTLFTDEDKKVRDQDHITEKHRGSADSNCNINIKLTKKVSVIFHNFRGYNSHLIMQEIGKFSVEISFIPNRLEKYNINKKLVFIDNMQFMNYGLDALVKNLTDHDFKYLSQEFNGEQLNLVKQKGVYPYEYINGFEKFSEDKLPDRCEFYSSLKMGVSMKNIDVSVKKMGISVKKKDISMKKIIYMLSMFRMNLK